MAALLICPQGGSNDTHRQYGGGPTVRTHSAEAARVSSMETSPILICDLAGGAYLEQCGKVEVKWVEGHIGDPGNEAADEAARDRHTERPWYLSPQRHTDLHCHAMFMGEAVEDDLRQLVKKQSAARIHHTWAQQNRTQEFVED